jgi:hypothetical protein
MELLNNTKFFFDSNFKNKNNHIQSILLNFKNNLKIE